MRCHTKSRKGQKQPRIRKKKLSRAVQLAVLSMSVAPGTALADLEVSRVVSAATSVTNTATITPAGDYINLDGANTQLTGGVTNSGSIAAGDEAFDVSAGSTISGAITNSGSIAAGDDAFEVNTGSDISGAITNSGTITAGDNAFQVNASTISGGIVNSGTITGATNAINIVNATAPITITNSGLINGTVILDDSILRLNGLTSRVTTGAVTGGAGSTVTVNGTFATENTFSVDNFAIGTGGRFTIGHGVTTTSGMSNAGTLAVAGGVDTTLSGNYTQTTGVISSSVRGAASAPSPSRVPLTCRPAV